MDRKKNVIRKKQDERRRQANNTKRKNGLIKKAMELSILCGCEIALVMFNSQSKLIQYSSHDIDQTLSKFIDEKPLEAYMNEHLSQFLPKDGQDKGSDEDQLAHGTENQQYALGYDPTMMPSMMPAVSQSMQMVLNPQMPQPPEPAAPTSEGLVLPP